MNGVLTRRSAFTKQHRCRAQKVHTPEGARSIHMTQLSCFACKPTHLSFFQEISQLNSGAFFKFTLQSEGPCTRCQMVCIDQSTGMKTREPLRTMAAAFLGKMKFGVYLSRVAEGNVRISVGDEVIDHFTFN